MHGVPLAGCLAHLRLATCHCCVAPPCLQILAFHVDIEVPQWIVEGFTAPGVGRPAARGDIDDVVRPAHAMDAGVAIRTLLRFGRVVDATVLATRLLPTRPETFEQGSAAAGKEQRAAALRRQSSGSLPTAVISDHLQRIGEAERARAEANGVAIDGVVSSAAGMALPYALLEQVFVAIHSAFASAHPATLAVDGDAATETPLGRLRGTLLERIQFYLESCVPRADRIAAAKGRELQVRALAAGASAAAGAW